MKFKNLIISITTLFFLGCNVHLVPTKSSEALILLNSIQVNSASIFSSPDLTYSGNEAQYTLVNNEIDSLIQIDIPRKKDILVNQDKGMQTQLNEIATEHQAAGSITPRVQANYNAYFKSFVHARLISENSLK